MEDGAVTQMHPDIEFCLATEADYDQVMAMSTDVYSGMDYMGHFYFSWLQEPNRMVFLAKRNGQVIALESVWIVDDGETAVFEGLRVAPWERGQGIARMIQLHCINFIKTNYPEVKRRRQTVGNKLPEVLNKFRILGERSVLIFHFKASDIDGILSYITRAMEAEGKVWQQASLLQDSDVRRIFLDREVIDTVLPNKKIMYDWHPFEPTESNISLLLSKQIRWMADCSEHPHFLSLCLDPYLVSMGQEFLRLNIDMFGKVLDEAKKHLVTQLQISSGKLTGTVLCFLFLDTLLTAKMEEFVKAIPAVEKPNILPQMLLEDDL
ncbi:histidine N-acetyltransferase-like [Protopterus annectens]|uniref:histidine N-acetyltransferase-like n=1 Tax=Protopterus annectens TaxID=7888 RepID=UPI001CFA17C8|nr:histidine N-acetyltransferase-like [Protopterus annectens]